jgi:uncharacterized protein
MRNFSKRPGDSHFHEQYAIKRISRAWTAVLAGMLLLLALVVLTACSSGGGSATAAPVGLPNPASQYCVEQGGTSTIQTRGDGGQYGVCVFEDNRQCEEFAMMNGDCPVGGLKVTGYLTDASRYCAITGGSYSTDGSMNSDGEEDGTCTFSGGSSCNVYDYYDGSCGP